MLLSVVLLLNHPLWPSLIQLCKLFGDKELFENHVFQAACRLDLGPTSTGRSLYPLLSTLSRADNRSFAVSTPGRRLEECDGTWYDVTWEYDALVVCEVIGECPLSATRADCTGADCFCLHEDDGFVTADVARAHCSSRFGQLVEVESASDNNRVNELVDGRPAHIGIERTVGVGWVLSSRRFQRISYTNWHPGEPNNHGEEDENYVSINLVCDERLSFDRLLGFVFRVILLLVTVAALWCEMCCYRRSVSKRRAEVQGAFAVLQSSPYHFSQTGGTFRYDLCSCSDACGTFLHAMCCHLPRIGDTFSAALGTHWALLGVLWTLAYVVASILDVVGESFNALNLAGIVITVYGTSKRQALRRKFGGDPGPHCCTDCLVWWCCAFCAATQEARQVDEASGLRMHCCCNLAPFTSPFVSPMAGAVVIGQPVVGQPVGAGMSPVVPMAIVIATPVQTFHGAMAVAPEPMVEARASPASANTFGGITGPAPKR